LKRDRIIGVRVTDYEYARIKELCKIRGYKNLSDCIREALRKDKLIH